MNFLTTLYVVAGAIVTIPYTNFVRADYDPMVVLYYPLEDIYEMSDFDTLQRILSQTKLTKGNFSHILLLCRNIPARSYLERYDLSLMKIIPYTRQTSIKGQVECEMPHVPKIFYENSYSSVGYSIYMVEKYPKEFTIPYGLPDFPRLPEDNDELKVLQYRPSHTTHRIHAFKRKLRSTNTTKRHPKMEISLYLHYHQYEGKLYGPKFQNKMFEFYRNPNANHPGESQSQNEYFDQNQMVPIDDFVDDTKRMAACITIDTTTSIWRRINEGALDKVQRFIQSVADKLALGTLMIKTQPIGQLYLPTNIDNEETPVYMNPVEKRALVPKNLVKIIGYRSPSPLIAEKFETMGQLHRYYMIIVIKNQLPATDERICNKQKADICGLYGWQFMLTAEEKEYVYCCTFDDEDLKENNLIEIYNSHEPLNLYQLVTHTDDNGKILNTVNIVEALRSEHSEATTSANVA